MPRYLKTVFPCTTCGEPARVTHLRYAERARCQACAERAEAIARVGWVHEAGNSEIKRGRQIEGAERLRHFCEGLSRHTKGLALRVEAQSKLRPRERRANAAAALNWIDYLVRNLGKLRPHFEALAEEATFPVIDGAGLAAVPAPDLATVEPDGLSLRLRVVRNDP
jgi:hypothetical protein